MRTIFADNTNFQGKLVIENRLSNKPSNCIKKVQDNICSLIQKKDYNLYIKQYYDKNEIGIYADYPFPKKPSQKSVFQKSEKESLPINAKSSRYIEAAKSAIEKYDKAILDKEQKEWDKKQKSRKIEDLKDIIETVVFLPLFIINDILHSINPKRSKNFEKYIDKII